MAWRHKRWSGGDVDVANTFLFHQRTVMLSVRDSVVYSCMSKQWAIYALWSTLTVSSRSLLAIWPSGLPQETSCAVMSAGKCARHTMECALAGFGDVAEAIGCGWGVQGTAVGTGVLPLHTYTCRRLDSHPL